MLFADDLQVYFSFLPHYLEIGVHRLNTDIATVVVWATSNGLSLNVRKTKAIILASDPYYHQLNLQRDALNSVKLPYSAKVQCLGLWIQTSLDWSRQVGSASGRVYGVLRVLRRLRRLLSRQNRKELIETLVFPHLDYACAAYDDLFDYQNLQLHRALNACVRFVVGSISRREHVTPYRIGLGWVSVIRGADTSRLPSRTPALLRVPPRTR
uniref:Reverse transcriptase domain-containing protein n=1 Tax=Trichogramma kaykai TaxID=54128 RepID=A0ABD2WV44_9HYME